MSGNKYEMIFCIINSGFSETVMDAAREAGARGGTVIRARGTAGKEAEFKALQEEYKAAVLLNLETWHLKPALEEKVKQNLEMELASGGNGFSDLPPELAGLPACR